MSPTRNAPYIASCKGKVPIATREAAIAAAANCRRASGEPATAYQCPHCGLWHTGRPFDGQSIDDRIREPRVRPDPVVAHPNRLARRK